jgi:putative heme iron utilization protein
MSIDDVSIRDAYQNLREGFDTVLLATVGKEGVPDASYAPYVIIKSRYYVYVSELASHTGNMLITGKAGLLFIENERDAKSLFARRRLASRADVVEISRSGVEFDQILEAFADKFGAIINSLRDMQDFRLMQLTPSSGRFVSGFGQAYDITGEELDQIQHINDRGHGHRAQA